ncbi:MAG: DNA polymerase III [Verrucomicrobia bacterium]|nr:MAG: DNA polymerase III [Verrucomicrobiota bacterium]
MKAISTSGSSVGQDDSFPHKLTRTSAPRDRGHRTSSPNVDIAGRLDEVANIFVEQGANRFRIQAYRRAANVLRRLSRSVADIFAEQGIEGLEPIPGIGVTIARSIRDILLHGRLAMLDRLRGESDPIAILASVPGIGKVYAWRLHDDLGIETLEELELAAHDGRLEQYPGIGAKRLAGIRDSLAQRLGRIRRQRMQIPTTPALAPPPSAPQKPSVSELLDVDREYRDKVAADTLTKITPRRFNPAGEAWLPIMHTARNGRHYTALFLRRRQYGTQIHGDHLGVRPATETSYRCGARSRVRETLRASQNTIRAIWIKFLKIENLPQILCGIEDFYRGRACLL